LIDGVRIKRLLFQRGGLVGIFFRQEPQNFVKLKIAAVDSSMACRLQLMNLSLLRFRYSFICQGTSTSRQRRNLFGLWVKLPSVTTSRNHWKVEAIPLSALPKDTTSELTYHL